MTASARDSPVTGFNPKPDLSEKTASSLYLRDNPALGDVNTASRNLPPILRAPLGGLQGSVGAGVWVLDRNVAIQFSDITISLSAAMIFIKILQSSEFGE